LASSSKPFEPRGLRGSDELLQPLRITIDAEVVEMALQTSTQSGVLVLDRSMPVATTPIVDSHFGLS
jgi:hypothetical protein